MGDLSGGLTGRVISLIFCLLMVVLMMGCVGPATPVLTPSPVVVTATFEVTPIVVTATPSPVVVTATPAPIPVPLELDCFTLVVDPLYTPINSNPCIRGRVVQVPHWTADGRYHCTPRDFGYVSERGDQNTPAWVNCTTRVFEQGERDVIRYDLTEVNGKFGMSQYVGTFETGECYVIKQTGMIEGTGEMSNLSLVARLHPDDGGEPVVLRGQQFAVGGERTLNQPYKIFWYVTTDRALPSAVVEIYADLVWATFRGHLEAWTFEVTTAPDVLCDSPDVIEW